MYEMCIYDTVRFGQLKKDLRVVPSIRWSPRDSGNLKTMVDHEKAIQRDSTACGVFPDGNGRDLLPVFLCDYELGL